MPRDNHLYSGFVLHDYVLTFQVKDEARRAKLVELCAGPWLGDQATQTTWEVSNTLSPDEMEKTLLELIEEGDKVVYYYLSDSKRVFRVVLE
jgi:hypothetical protein